MDGQPTTVTAFFSLAPYRLLGLILLGGLVFTALSVMTLWRVTQSPTNPFSTYADILPGQPKQMADAHGFDCQKKTDYYLSEYATCTLIPKSRTFSQIEVLTADNKIVQSTFSVSENGLKYGDLMMTMSPDKLQIHPYEVFFFWQTLFVTVKTSKRLHAIALRPLYQITFTDVSYHGKTTTFSAHP